MPVIGLSCPRVWSDLSYLSVQNLHLYAAGQKSNPRSFVLISSSISDNRTSSNLTQFASFNMKFLEFTSLESINIFLNHLNVGESTIKGSLEGFSCKHMGTDRKLSMSLEHEILDYLGQSADSDPPSPVEYLSSRSSRKTLIYLVLTLSHMYPDYDFSAVRTHLFFKEEEWDSFKQIFETYMFEADKEWTMANGGCSLLESMAKAIDEVVKLGECEIYSYNPDFEGDPFLEKGAIWSFNFFFYNRKLKRIVSFRCCCLSNLAADGFIGDGLFAADEEDDLLFDICE